MRRVILPLLSALLAAPAMAAEPDPRGVEFFETKVRPVLVEHCYSCHSAAAKKARGGLLLDSRDAVRKGGDNGPAVVPGKPDDSLLLKLVSHAGEKKMPPNQKLSDAAIADLTRWVEMGAPDPRDPAATAAGGIDWKAARSFWSFRPIRLPSLPEVRDASWPKTGIDRFILAKLEAQGLRPVGPADPRTLIRRATFDLIGLPPTPEEVEAFVKAYGAKPQAAYEALVDRLLASPHYGERWGRYWLDVARYAEDQAHTFAVQPYTNAWRYRDWVIDALNADVPYDRFVKLQIAADLVEGDSPGECGDRAALGFFGLGAQYYKNSDAAKAAADELDDRVDTLARGFLGLTVSCARCHDHKFDPIPTQDYYSIAGVFSNCKLAPVPLAPKAEVDRYQEGQKLVQETDRKVKEFVRVEKTHLAEARSQEVAAYMTAAWKLKARRQEHANYAAAEQAKEDKLDAATLDRWAKFLDGGQKTAQPVPALDAWRKLPMPAKGSPPEPGAEVQETAKQFQEEVQKLLTQKGMPAKDAPKNDLLALLFGDNGVMPVSDKDLDAALSAEKKATLDGMKAELDRVTKSAPPAPPMAHGLSEAGTADLKVYVRGNPAQQGDVAPRRFLRVLAGDDPPRFTQGSGRKELAEAIASPDNPLTARVIVNRVWAWHFGRGIVGTPSNFGNLGERPTHPELLDYLAARFIASGWSLKALHRDIMLSAVYQLGADHDDAATQADPDNRLLWHFSRRRLDVEAWRDALLAVSGQLDAGFGGPTTDLGSPQNRRRTVYGKISRHDLNGLLRLFDFPDANITSEKRTETTVPQQQLFVLNSPFFVAQAKALAARVKAEADNEPGRVKRAYLLAFGRPPAEAELQLGLRYLAGTDAPDDAAKNQLTRWERYAQALLASNEFLYLD